MKYLSLYGDKYIIYENTFDNLWTNILAHLKKTDISKYNMKKKYKIMVSFKTLFVYYSCLMWCGYYKVLPKIYD
jgi:L-rhamnose mutarotase